jgi:predicted phosphodiesterase
VKVDVDKMLFYKLQGLSLMSLTSIKTEKNGFLSFEVHRNFFLIERLIILLRKKQLYIWNEKLSIILMKGVEEFQSFLKLVNNNRPPKMMLNLIRETSELLKNELPVVKIEGDVIICGDIHGDFDSLWEIIELFFELDNKKIIFLGDYVDKGSDSIQVILLLFYLKYNFPNQVILLRGNHESPTTKITSKNEWRHTTLGKKLISVFSHLPLVCIVDESIMCLHGGIAETDFRNLESKSISIGTIGRQIVWNDFICEEKAGNLRGIPFDETLFQKFLEINQIKMVIRGHQHIQNGFVEYIPGLLTITSSRNLSAEKSAVVVVIEKSYISPTFI